MKRSMWFPLALIVAAAALASSLFATPANPPYYMTPQVIKGTFDELDINVDSLPDGHWRTRLKTNGSTDLYVVTNVWRAATATTPAGTSGWHTHPGPSLIIVTAGAVTAYNADDPTCTPVLYPAGSTLVDPGEGHAHVLRNEGPVDASTTVVQFLPAAAARRIDAEQPATCPPGVN